METAGIKILKIYIFETIKSVSIIKNSYQKQQVNLNYCWKDALAFRWHLSVCHTWHFKECSPMQLNWLGGWVARARTESFIKTQRIHRATELFLRCSTAYPFNCTCTYMSLKLFDHGVNISFTPPPLSNWKCRKLRILITQLILQHILLKQVAKWACLL